MKILVAEHDRIEREALCDLLEVDGHEVIRAATCADAVALFSCHDPDLVLVDIGLPDADGCHCAREIGAMSGSAFSPAMLTTSVDDRLTLEQFVASEAADFIDAPGNVTVLRAKIAGYERTRDIYRQLERTQSRLQQEVRMAQQMFETVTRQRPPDVEFLRHWTITAGHFSGDLLVYERNPQGSLHVMMGDFTGHGLAAAIGAIPTSDTFFAMTRKGHTISEIAAEINRKLKAMLPTGHFCAAILLKLSPLLEEVEVWNGGQPPLLTCDHIGRVSREVPSFGYPLGIVDDSRFDAHTLTFPLTGVSHIVLCSDGLLDAENARGETFGLDRLHGALEGMRKGNVHPLQHIKSELVRFLQGASPHDDVSLLTVEIAPA